MTPVTVSVKSSLFQIRFNQFIGLAIIVSIIVTTLVILNMEDIVILTKVYGTANIETVRMAVT